MTEHPDSLLLDDRQRAMLREMGVQVWQPRVVADAAAAVAAVVPAVPLPRHEDHPVAAPPAPASAPRPTALAARMPVPAPAPVAAPAPALAPTAVLRGEWRAMFPASAENSDAPVWLVLTDSPTTDPQEGDAGRLFEAMLRAARLHRTARVWVASVGRAGEEGMALPEALDAALATHRPAMVLTLGRLSSQAALERSEPLGKLRGMVHAVGDTPLVASYEPAYLLRAQDDKARAWEDLCRALAAAAGRGP